MLRAAGATPVAVLIALIVWKKWQCDRGGRFFCGSGGGAGFWDSGIRDCQLGGFDELFGCAVLAGFGAVPSGESHRERYGV